MGKHGVLVWDRIFEGRKAKSAAELARIGNAGTGGVGRVGGKRWWGGRARKLLAGRGVWGVGGKTQVIGEDPPPVCLGGPTPPYLSMLESSP